MYGTRQKILIEEEEEEEEGFKLATLGRKRGLTASQSLTVWSSSVTSKILRRSCCGSYTLNGSQDLSAKSQSNIPSKKTKKKSSKNNLPSLMMMMMMTIMKSDSSCCLENLLQKKKKKKKKMMMMMMGSSSSGSSSSRVPSFFTKASHPQSLKSKKQKKTHKSKVVQGCFKIYNSSPPTPHPQHELESV